MSVLFVGNSYTFYNDMPDQVTALSVSDPGAATITTERVVQGGATLKLHHEETGARDKIQSGGWTHVVLQEKSTGTLHDKPDFHTYVGRLGKLAKKAGAELVLYQTWARAPGHTVYRWGWSGRKPAVMLERVAAEYNKAAGELGALVVPVGRAWERCLAKHPRLNLYDEDLHHASPLGSHLAASVFYVSLTGRDPTPLAYQAPGVAQDDALALRAVAWDYRPQLAS